MKRFASHYVYIPLCGFLKQYVAEVNDEGVVVALLPLEEEIESVIWKPGVMVLVSRDYPPDKLESLVCFDHAEVLIDVPEGYKDLKSLDLTIQFLYPFDFAKIRC